MTSRQDLDVLAEAGRAAVRAAQDDLLLFMSRIDIDNRAAAQAALHEFLPALIAQYGDVAATAAAEWYENVRAAQLGGTFYAELGASASERAIHSAVGYAVAASDPAQVPSRLLGSLQRLVTYSERTTIGYNAARDRVRPRFARVPQGAKTCAWCSMLASRGFDYGSRRTAGDQGRGVGDDFHDDCDCRIVAEWGDESGIEGYDPDRYLNMYEAARAAGRDGSPAAIASRMRAMFPDEFTDGHAH
jgi:hypothetical protein